MGNDFDFDPIVYSGEVDKKVPEKPGVHLGYNGKKGEYLRITYVGESKNLKRCLKRHGKGCTHYSYEVIEGGDIRIGETEDVRKKRKRELIEKFAPECNRRGVDTSRAWGEEWVIKPGKNGMELWKRPDSTLKRGDPSYSPPEKIRSLDLARVEDFDLGKQPDVGSRGKDRKERDELQ